MSQLTLTETIRQKFEQLYKAHDTLQKINDELQSRPYSSRIHTQLNLQILQSKKND